MKFFFCAMIFLLSVSHLEANSDLQDSTYIVYHQVVNKAERLYYIENNIDSALACYDRVFMKFDFLFLKDLLNAAQISAYNGKLDYKKYLLIGFKYGLQMKHLINFPLLEPLMKDIENDITFQAHANLNRKEYIRNINYDYLLKIYDIGIEDQIQKNQSDRLYASRKRINIQKMKNWIKKYGFPSSKVLGVDDKYAFRNIGHPGSDLVNRKLKYSSELDYYSTEDESFSNTISMIVLIHNQCAFVELQEFLYNAMLKGEIHPREIGCLYDNMFRNVNSRFYSCVYPNASKGLFYLNSFCNYNRFAIEKKEVDKLRAEWYIVELDVDEKKKQFEERHGFKLFYGFLECM